MKPHEYDVRDISGFESRIFEVNDSMRADDGLNCALQTLVTDRPTRLHIRTQSDLETIEIPTTSVSSSSGLDEMRGCKERGGRCKEVNYDPQIRRIVSAPLLTKGEKIS